MIAHNNNNNKKQIQTPPKHRCKMQPSNEKISHLRSTYFAALALLSRAYSIWYIAPA